MRLLPLLASLSLGVLSALSLGCDGGSGPGTSSSGGGGSGGEGGGGGGGGDTGPCAGQAFQVTGSLDGAMEEASYPYLSFGFEDSEFHAAFCGRGNVSLFATVGDFAAGTKSDAQGLFRLPSQGPSPGVWFCAGAGTAVDNGAPGQATISLEAPSALGACPGGTPVTGAVTGCVDLAGSGHCAGGVDSSIASTLEGASFDWSNAVVSLVHGEPGEELLDIHFGGLGGGGDLILDLEGDTIVGGILKIAPGTPDAGAVYCVGSGTLTQQDWMTVDLSLAGLSRLGTCLDATPVPGSLSMVAP